MCRILCVPKTLSQTNPELAKPCGCAGIVETADSQNGRLRNIANTFAKMPFIERRAARAAPSSPTTRNPYRCARSVGGCIITMCGYDFWIGHHICEMHCGFQRLATLPSAYFLDLAYPLHGSMRPQRRGIQEGCHHGCQTSSPVFDYQRHHYAFLSQRRKRRIHQAAIVALAVAQVQSAVE